MTPGQAAYEARAARMGGRRDIWDELPASYREIEEAGAQAAINVFVQQPAPLTVSLPGGGQITGTLTAKRDPWRERAAEILAEGKP